MTLIMRIIHWIALPKLETRKFYDTQELNQNRIADFPLFYSDSRSRGEIARFL